MQNLRITQSLLSSWAYQYKAADGYEADAREEFLKSLNREKKETTPAQQSGIDFENCIYADLAGIKRPENKGNEDGIAQIRNIIHGAQIQVRCESDLYIPDLGINFRLVGVLDALKDGIIYDIKYLTKSMGSVDLQGKYLDSPQHPMYFKLVPGAREFRYLVSDGKDLYTEVYERGQTPNIETEIRRFIEDLKKQDIYDIYVSKWEVTK